MRWWRQFNEKDCLEGIRKACILYGESKITIQEYFNENEYWKDILRKIWDDKTA